MCKLHFYPFDLVIACYGPWWSVFYGLDLLGSFLGHTLKKNVYNYRVCFSDHKISLGKFICLWNYLSRLIIFKEV